MRPAGSAGGVGLGAGRGGEGGGYGGVSRHPVVVWGVEGGLTLSDVR